MFALQTPLFPWPRICLFWENDQGFLFFLTCELTFHPFKKNYGSIIALRCCVSAVEQSESAVHMCISPLF